MQKMEWSTNETLATYHDGFVDMPKTKDSLIKEPMGQVMAVVDRFSKANDADTDN